jgi:biopolymer transport protein ExbD
MVFNRRPISPADLESKLTELAKLYPDQAVILRGDQNVKYDYIVKALDIFRSANIWNVLFATAKPE